MTKTEFFEKHGGGLHTVTVDDAEYGEFLILHPEEIELAKQLQNEGFIIVSVHETESGEDWVDTENEVDFGNQPHKYGYFALTH
jgi:hypothetical protein